MAESSIFSDTTRLWDDYRNSLDQGADYNAINDVDQTDSYYDLAFGDAFYTFSQNLGEFNPAELLGGEGQVGGGSVDFSLEGQRRRKMTDAEYRSNASNVPAYLRNFGQSTHLAKTQQAFSSVKDLTSTEDLSAALSSFYGYDISPKEQSFSRSDFGGNLNTHSSSSDADLQQFHSLVEPILREQISYLQATQSLEYQDALMTAYQSDPMLQALYHKYDVTPIRQTKDGSTYLYDPFSFAEIRTTEVKDPNLVEVAVKIGISALAGFVLGPAMVATVGNAAGAAASAAGVTSAAAITAIGTTAASMATQATIAKVMGGDPLKAALFAGIPVGNIPIPGVGRTLTELTGGNIDFFIGGATTPLAMALKGAFAGATGATGTGGGSTTGATPDFNPYINSIAASVSASNLEEEEQEATIDFTFNPYTESEEAAAAGSAVSEAENASNAAQEALNTPSSYTSAIDDYEGRFKEAMIRNRGRPSQASRFYLEKIRAAEAAEKQELNEKRIAANVAKGNYDAAVKNESEIRRGEERTYQAEKAAAYQAFLAEDAARKERNRIRAEEAAVSRARADELAAKEETARIAREEAQAVADAKAAKDAEDAKAAADAKAAKAAADAKAAKDKADQAAKAAADAKAKNAADAKAKADKAAADKVAADLAQEKADKATADKAAAVVAKAKADATKEEAEKDKPPVTDVSPPIDETDPFVDEEPPEFEDPIDDDVNQKFPPEDKEGGGSGGGSGGGTTGGGGGADGGGGDSSGSGGSAGGDTGGNAPVDPTVEPEPTTLVDGEAIGDGVLLRQIYEAALNAEDPKVKEGLIESYINMGGMHSEALQSNTEYDEVYPNPIEYEQVERPEESYDEEKFDLVYNGNFIGGSFEQVDVNKDGTVSQQELWDWEHKPPSDEIDPTLNFLGFYADTDTEATEKSINDAIASSDQVTKGTGSGNDPVDSTDPSSGDSGGTGTSTGGDQSGAGEGTGTGTGEGGGTGEGSGTGAGTGSDYGQGSEGDSAGTGAGSGAGSSAGGGTEGGQGGGTGEGTGTGDGDGSGSGTGDGDGSGTGTGAGVAAGMLSAGKGGLSDIFKGYEFSPMYQRPALAQAARQYEATVQPTVGMLLGQPQDQAKQIAEGIRNVRSFDALGPREVEQNLESLNDSLLSEAVMQQLYGNNRR